MTSVNPMGGDGGQAMDVGQRPTVVQVRARSFTREHIVDALRKYFPEYGHPAVNRKTGDARLLQEALIALLSGEAPLDAIDAYDGERDGPCKIARTATGHRSSGSSCVCTGCLSLQNATKVFLFSVHVAAVLFAVTVACYFSVSLDGILSAASFSAPVFHTFVLLAGQPEGGTGVSGCGGQHKEHANQPEDSEMDGVEADSDGRDDSFGVGLDERTFIRMQLGL